MKPKKTGTLSAFGILTALFAQQAIACDPNQTALQQRVDVVIDAATGDVLFGQDENTDFFQASMTKRMTLLLTLRALRDGTLKEDQRIPLSSIPYNNGRRGVEKGDPIPFIFKEISVWDAVLAMNTASSNRAPQALAIAIAGSENNFAGMMNDEAKRMGIDAHFENPAGYPTSAGVEHSHHITALGHALIVRQLFNEFPEQMAKLRIASASLTGYMRAGSAVAFNVGATNKFLKAGNFYEPEVMGGKTGTTCASGGAMDAAWMVNGRMVIGVTAGHANPLNRYAALRVQIHHPDGMFTARLEKIHADEERAAWMKQWSPTYVADAGGIEIPVTTSLRLYFKNADGPRALLISSPPKKPPPSAPDQPFLPPLLMTRLEPQENSLRAPSF